MRIWYNSIIDMRRRDIRVEGDTFHIGSGPHNDLVLGSAMVAKEAVRLERKGTEWDLILLSPDAIQLNGDATHTGPSRPISPGLQLRLYPYTLEFDLSLGSGLGLDGLRSELDLQMAQAVTAIHLDLLDRMRFDSQQDDPDVISAERLMDLERTIDYIAEDKGVFNSDNVALLDHVSGRCLYGAVLELAGMRDEISLEPSRQAKSWTKMLLVVPEREVQMSNTARAIASRLKLGDATDLTQRIDRIDDGFWQVWDEVQESVQAEFKRYLCLRYVRKEVKDIVFGYGPLEDLLRLPTISEIMVLDRDHIYIERRGVVENSGRRFVSDAVTIAIIQRIVSRVGRRIDKARPLVDARLADGSRVNAVIPPIAVSGPCITIRKFPLKRLGIDDLVKYGTLTSTAAQFLRAAVASRRNILISGGTGSGKTTLLNCLSNFIPDKERIVTVEDTAELQLNKEHVVRMETKEANLEGAGAFTIRDLVRNALRMRPDRVVVGECRGPEALDMLQAMNTGHDGSLTTIHANSANDVMLRLEVLVQMAADLPVQSIHRQIASAIDLVVQLHRLRDGRRRVTQISEVIGVDPATNCVRTKDLFLLEGEDADAVLSPTGLLPTFIGEMIQMKVIDLELFYRH